MREAGFVTVFVGIETPDIDALKRIDKGHNTTLPILDAVETLNRYGLEVVSGIILGLDGDTPETADRLLDFAERSRIPMLTINLLQALPKTPLWERLQREGRIVDDDGRESNVQFLALTRRFSPSGSAACRRSTPRTRSGQGCAAGCDDRRGCPERRA